MPPIPFEPSPLYVICDADVCATRGWRLVDFARACLEGGATLLQVRAKATGGREFLEAATAIVELARPAGACVIVNDRADVARASGAAGVHVGHDDLPPWAVRLVVDASTVVGLSTHGEAQVRAALERAGPADRTDYLAIGPVFGTATKATGYDPRGLDAVRVAARLLAASRRPLVAIGGITLDRAPSVLAAGAQSVAVIADLLATGDPAARVGAFLRALR
jgi:thiamine-phosphate pyrophosphorylase